MAALGSPMMASSSEFRMAAGRWSLKLSAAAAALLLLAASAPGGQKRAAPRPASPPKLTIRYDSAQIEHDVYHLHGHVQVVYGDVTVTADQGTYNSTTGEVTATGHVTFDSPQAHLKAQEARYNIVTKRGWFAHATGYVHPRLRPRPGVLQTSRPFYVQARRVERLDESNYIIEHGRVTTCDHPATGWTISTRKAHVIVDDKMVAHEAVIHFLGVPALYLPLMANSLAPSPRQTGFLLPTIGNSSQKGLILGDAFFWAINPSADLTLGLENYSIRGLARMGRFRARPSATSGITVNYYGVNDKGSGALRQQRAGGDSVRATGESDNLGDGFRGVVDVDYINSLAFRLTWASNFSEAISSEAHQSGFVTKNFDAYSINLDASRYQNFLSAEQKPGNSIVINKAPEFSFDGIEKRVKDSPFYFSFETSAGSVSRSEPGFATPDFSDRLDFHPRLTLRTKPLWGFHFTPAFGVRATHYGTSLLPGRGALTRLLGEVSLDLRPPSLEKVFSKPHDGYRFKHVIEPDIRYKLVRARDPQDIMDVVRFDDLDVLTETNEIEYSVTNALMVRKDVPDGSPDTPQARDLISWRLSQKYYFDPTFGGALPPGETEAFEPTLSLTGFAFPIAAGRHLSPVVSVLKFSPSSNYDTELRTDLNPSGGGVLNAGVTSRVHRGPMGFELTDFFINRTASLATPIALSTTTPLSALPSFNLLRAVGTYGDVSRKGFSGAAGIDYNFSQHLTAQFVSQASYNFGCWGIDFEYRRFDLGPLRRENQFRVAISFANIGTFGNFHTRERLF